MALRWEADECLPWPFARFPSGYGAITRHGRTRPAARVVCELAHGAPPTSRHEVAHSCGRGHEGCVNPRHLRWATHAENMDDRVDHGTSNRGERCGTVKLTEAEVLAIRAATGSQREIAEQFGISQPHVSDIKLRKRWSWLD